ncbi:hypothetical protein P3S67_008411 [Capsicum chacoense]
MRQMIISLRALCCTGTRMVVDYRSADGVAAISTRKLHFLSEEYVEENERLRAILGEWSNRAAKLERALELERMSNLELQKKMTTLKTQTRE